MGPGLGPVDLRLLLTRALSPPAQPALKAEAVFVLHIVQGGGSALPPLHPALKAPMLVQAAPLAPPGF